MSAIKPSLLIFLSLILSARICANPSEEIINFSGPPAEMMIKFLSDPLISSSDVKIKFLRSLLPGSDKKEIQSIILPEIKNIQEIYDMVEGYEHEENAEIFFTYLPFGPLAEFLLTTKEILTSNHANRIGFFIKEYEQYQSLFKH